MVITVESTSAMVTWERWGSNTMDTGDGPIIAYIVYITSASTSSWIIAGNVSVTDQSPATYNFLVEGLEPSTKYSISIAAVRDGQGGEGPMSPIAVIQTLTTKTATTQRATTKGILPDFSINLWQMHYNHLTKKSSTLNRQCTSFSSNSGLRNSYETLWHFKSV